MLKQPQVGPVGWVDAAKPALPNASPGKSPFGLLPAPLTAAGDFS